LIHDKTTVHRRSRGIRLFRQHGKLKSVGPVKSPLQSVPAYWLRSGSIYLVSVDSTFVTTIRTVAAHRLVLLFSAVVCLSTSTGGFPFPFPFPSPPPPPTPLPRHPLHSYRPPHLPLYSPTHSAHHPPSSNVIHLTYTSFSSCSSLQSPTSDN
jgi:hypothetical protein